MPTPVAPSAPPPQGGHASGPAEPDPRRALDPPGSAAEGGVSLVVMGVSGCGKSRVGTLSAERLGLPLVEGDEFHSEVNRALMREGVPLTDAHRADWLAALSAELQARPGGVVLTCSALKASYRDRLRAAAPGLRFAWLDLDAAAAQARVAQRSAHFFPAALVATQFDALEPPLGEPGVLRLDALLPPETLAERAVLWITGADLPR